MTPWTQQGTEHHSTEDGFGVAAWDSGWMVYIPASEFDVQICIAKGRASSLQEAKDRAQWAARARSAYESVLEKCEAIP